jgi:hypothetical protein
MAETFTTNYGLSKFDQGDNPPVHTAAKLNTNLDVIDASLTSLAAAPDIYAATRVVSLIAGDGTDLTIAAAIAALPAAGGTIFLKQGVYTITATLVLPGAKNVLIKGAGKGATVLNLTTAAIPLFQIGAAATGKYALRDFSVTGDGATAQKFIDLAEVVDVFVENVSVTDFRDIVNDSAGGEVVFQNCAFTMPFLGNCSFWRGTGPAGTLVWIYTEATLATATSDAIVGSPEWDVTDSYIGGPGASFYACGKIVWQTFRLDNAEVTVSAGDSRIDECDFVNAGIIFTSQRNVVGDSVFSGGSPSSFLALQFSDVGNVVTGNAFNGGVSTAIDILAGATETVISGNRFFPSYFTCVKNASSGAVMTGNSGMQVIESGAADNNRYSNNTVFDGSTIIGPASVVNDWNTRDIAASPTLDETHRTVLVNATVVARVVNLPTAASARYRVYTIKKVDASVNTVTVDGSGAETIDGALTKVLTAQYDSIAIQSNGTSWAVIASDLSDIYAATRVVSLIAGDGTDLTIAAAIAALPAAGGSIYIKQGTYPLAASLVPTNKPITLIGAGAGAVIDLGANAISAFLINFDQRYSFSNLKILGSGIAGQTAFEFNIGGSSGQDVTVETVLVDNVEKTFLIAGTDFPLVHTTMCFFKVANLATSRHWDGVGEWHGTDTICTFTGFTHRGGITGNPDLYWVNCEINLTNGGAVNFVQMDRCKFQNGTLVITAQGSLVCDSLFDTTVALARFIDLLAGADSVVISCCEFGAVTSEHIRVASNSNIVAECPGCSVTETGAANANSFSNLAAGTIIGPTTSVNDWNTRDIAASPTLDITHRTALVDATAAARTITLPTAASAKYRVYTIKKIDASVNVVTIDAAGAETIDGALTVVLTLQWERITIQSNGTAWLRID